MQKYFDIENMLKKCPSVGKIKEPFYGGKSGKTLVYEVELDTNPIEFLAEISQDKDFKYIGVLLAKSNNTVFTVYVLKVVDDLFSYLMQEGAFDNFDKPLFEAMQIVEKVVECMKSDSLAINYNFYFNEITSEWFWKYANENIIL